MHGHMALNDHTTAPRCQSLCDVQFARLPSPCITAVVANDAIIQVDCKKRT